MDSGHLVKHFVTALHGAFAGALVGLFVQYTELGGENLDQLLRRMTICAATWALGTVSLSFVFQWARGRRWAWFLGVAVVLGVLSTSLAVAGTVVLGFTTGFAWLQATSLTAIPAIGAWLGGAIALRSKNPQ